MNEPYLNALPLIVNVSAEKSGWPKIAAMSGVRMLATNAVITAPKAAPMTTATARSTTLPRMMKSRNPLNIETSSGGVAPRPAHRPQSLPRAPNGDD